MSELTLTIRSDSKANLAVLAQWLASQLQGLEDMDAPCMFEAGWSEDIDGEPLL